MYYKIETDQETDQEEDSRWIVVRSSGRRPVWFEIAEEFWSNSGSTLVRSPSDHFEPGLTDRNCLTVQRSGLGS